MDLDWRSVREEYTVFADDAVLALNKPSGISVTGERHDTDLVELAQAAGTQLYPVHRIDKVTSGLVLLATDLAAHGPLTRQFNNQTARKAYLAIVSGAELPDRGEINLPLSVGRKNRVRIAAPRKRSSARVIGGSSKRQTCCLRRTIRRGPCSAPSPGTAITRCSPCGR